MYRDLVLGIGHFLLIVILVGILVAMILALVTWIKSVVAPVIENFMVYPQVLVYYNSSLSFSGGGILLELYIDNECGREVRILQVEIESGDGAYVYRPLNPIIVPPSTNLNITIPRNGEKWITIGSPSPIIPGFRYRVKIYTEETVLIYDVVAREK